MGAFTKQGTREDKEAEAGERDGAAQAPQRPRTRSETQAPSFC